MPYILALRFPVIFNFKSLLFFDDGILWSSSIAGNVLGVAVKQGIGIP